MILTSPRVGTAEFARRTGWEMKPQGACKAEVCVPLGGALVVDGETGEFDVRPVAERLGMPLVGDDDAGVWALGPETAVTGRALSSAVAPDLELPDHQGRPFRLSSLRGSKVLLLAWASW